MTAGRSLNSSILREYDIRGTVGATLVSDDVLAIGRGFGSLVANEFGRGASVAVGYDGRLSSPNLFSALTDGLIQSGIKVINVGLGPTPMIYFATQQTSSHAGMGTWKWNHTGNSSTLQWCSYCWNGKFGN